MSDATAGVVAEGAPSVKESTDKKGMKGSKVSQQETTEETVSGNSSSKSPRIESPRSRFLSSHRGDEDNAQDSSSLSSGSSNSAPSTPSKQAKPSPGLTHSWQRRKPKDRKQRGEKTKPYRRKRPKNASAGEGKASWTHGQPPPEIAVALQEMQVPSSKARPHAASTSPSPRDNNSNSLGVQDARRTRTKRSLSFSERFSPFKFGHGHSKQRGETIQDDHDLLSMAGNPAFPGIGLHVVFNECLDDQTDKPEGASEEQANDESQEKNVADTASPVNHNTDAGNVKEVHEDDQQRQKPEVVDAQDAAGVTPQKEEAVPQEKDKDIQQEHAQGKEGTEQRVDSRVVVVTAEDRQRIREEEAKWEKIILQYLREIQMK